MKKAISIILITIFLFFIFTSSLFQTLNSFASPASDALDGYIRSVGSDYANVQILRLSDNQTINKPLAAIKLSYKSDSVSDTTLPGVIPSQDGYCLNSTPKVGETVTISNISTKSGLAGTYSWADRGLSSLL